MALSVRRILLLVGVAAMIVVGSALPAFATHVEHANAEACQGLVISLLATSNHPEGPFPPPIAAEGLGYDVKTYTERVRLGKTYLVYPNGETFGCPREEE